MSLCTCGRRPATTSTIRLFGREGPPIIGRPIVLEQSGELRWVEISTTPIVEEGNRFAGILGVARDVTDRKRHELRSPLTAIVGIPALLREDSNLDTEHRELLETLGFLGTIMSQMIDVSLELFRIERGEYRFKPETVDLVPLLFDLIAQQKYANEADVRGLRVSLGDAPLDPDQTLPIYTDEKLLFEILSNLLTNALEASPRDSAVLMRPERARPRGDAAYRVVLPR